jgi:hypothetical protein
VAIQHQIAEDADLGADSLAFVAELQRHDSGVVLVDAAIHGVPAVDELGQLQSRVRHTSVMYKTPYTSMIGVHLLLHVHICARTRT